MKKTILLFIAASTISITMHAQKEVNYEKLYYKDLKVENSDVTISVNNAVSVAGETKFQLKIINKTADYIIYKPQESKFIIDGKEMSVVEKVKVIEPNDFRTIVINLKGTGYNKLKNYSFLVDGLYKVSANTKGITAPDFKLPATTNDFKVGTFSCNLNKLYKESDKTEAKFKCSYNGDKVGFIFPSKTAVKMPDGNEYANAKSKASAILLLKGESDTFTLKWDKMEGGRKMDMQKVDMFIKWNDAFTEVDPEKMKSETINIEFDEATSNAKK